MPEPLNVPPIADNKVAVYNLDGSKRYEDYTPENIPDVSFTWLTGNTKVFNVTDSSKYVACFVNGQRLSRFETDGITPDQWQIFSSTEIEIIDTLPNGATITFEGASKLVGSNIQDGEITPSKTNFILQGKNLFNKEAGDISLGTTLNNAGGWTSADAGRNTSGYIEIISSLDYTLHNTGASHYYDIDKVWISLIGHFVGTTNTSTAPINAKYIRFAATVGEWDSAMVEQSSIPTEFEPYQFLLDNKHISSQYIVDLSFGNLKSKKWVSYGDSISQSYTWQNIVSDYLGLTEIRRAIGGTQVAEAGSIAWVDANGNYLDRPPSSQPAGSIEIISYMSHQQRVDTIPLDADIISVFGGANDAASNRTLGTINDTDTTTFYGAYQIMLDKIQVRCPNAEMQLYTLIENQSTSQLFEDMRDAIRKIGLKYKFPIVEMSESGINKNNYTTYLSDGVHPNFEGDKRLAKVAIRGMQNIII